MNLAILQTEIKTMSSLDIAKICDKEHKNVKRDIEVMLNQLGIDTPKFERIYFDSMNRQQTEYLLDKDLTLTLVSGYSAPLRFRIIQRWQELENPKELSRLEILQLAMQAEQEKIALQYQVDILQPKADAYDQFLDADGLLNSGTIGKLLGFQSAQAFNKEIKAKGVAFKSGGAWQFYADFKDKHIGKMVAWQKSDVNKGGTQLKWHTKAVDYFSNLLNKEIHAREGWEL